MAQISQNTISSTIALPPREEGTGHHCKRWARFDVGRQPAELLLVFLRAPATLDQMKMTRSPELGRSPFWERSSRALPDPEMLPRRVRRVGPRIVPAVKSPMGFAESWGVPLFRVLRVAKAAV